MMMMLDDMDMSISTVELSNSFENTNVSLKVVSFK